MAKKKKTRKSRPAKTKKSREVLVVASKIKAYIRDQGMNTSADAIASLSDKVYMLLDEASSRTKANGRKTVKPQDV